MSTTNGFHPPPSITSTSSEISKRLPSTSSTSSTSSNSTNTTSTATRKHSKTKITLPTVNETRIIKGTTTMKKKKKKKKKVLLETTRKRLPTSDSNNNPRKKLKPSAQSPRHLLTHPILHPSKKHSNQLDPKIIHSSPSKSEQHIHHHHPHINHDHCDSCGEFYGEMISCDTCPATFHLLCANPPLSREDVPQGSYFCENCRTKTDEEKQIEAIDAKLSLQVNGLKKQTARQTALEQMKLPTVGRSLVQPSGEIKFRATNNTIKCKTSSNFKRKRNQSSESSSSVPVKSSNPQIDLLRRLLFSCRPEEFRGPSLPFDDTNFSRESSTQKNSSQWQTFCFICRKSSLIQRASIHCDYCPLTYHLDCLTPPMTALPCSTDKWMCPNHIEPLLDRFLFDKNRFSTSERVKIYGQYAQIEHQNILQDFTRMRQTKSYLVSKTNHQRLERIEISHIPKIIEQAYANPSTNIDESVKIRENDQSISETLEAIITSISDGKPYPFLKNLSDQDKSTNVLEQIDRLLYSLNEPNYIQPIRHASTDGLATLIAAADALANDQIKSSSLLNSHSLLIDLCQFRRSHAALIHLRSKHVIYLHKQVIWFGLSPSTDICLTQFNADQTCRYVSDRHACLYYDRSNNQFELLNYSEYGTIVNGLRYGLGNLSDDDDDDDDGENGDENNQDLNQRRTENDNLQRCFCLSRPIYHSAWDGPAQLEQGTVVRIGCHEFLFYRHVVR